MKGVRIERVRMWIVNINRTLSMGGREGIHGSKDQGNKRVWGSIYNRRGNYSTVVQGITKLKLLRTGQRVFIYGIHFLIFLIF